MTKGIRLRFELDECKDEREVGNIQRRDARKPIFS